LFIWFVWLNQTGPIDQMNQINHRPSRQSRSAIQQECFSVVSPTNLPEFAGGSLRIFSSIDHNGQRLTVQESIRRKDIT
jgi:hypothetical protein